LRRMQPFQQGQKQLHATKNDLNKQLICSIYWLRQPSI